MQSVILRQSYLIKPNSILVGCGATNLQKNLLSANVDSDICEPVGFISPVLRKALIRSLDRWHLIAALHISKKNKTKKPLSHG